VLNCTIWARWLKPILSALSYRSWLDTHQASHRCTFRSPWLYDNRPATPLKQGAYLHPVDVLFESATISVPTDLDWTTIDVGLGGLDLVDGETYAWVLDGFVTHPDGIPLPCADA
jgi:hypothetical protein